MDKNFGETFCLAPPTKMQNSVLIKFAHGMKMITTTKVATAT